MYKRQEYIIIGYAATKTEGLQMLADYNRNPYDTKAAKMTFDEAVSYTHLFRAALFPTKAGR